MKTIDFSNIKHFNALALLVCSILCLNSTVRAQLPTLTKPEKIETRKGNKLFDKENYTDAEAAYKKALDKNHQMPEATFNLGDAVYKQKRYDEAAKQFQATAQSNPDPKIRSKALHNLGNTFLEQRKWEPAISAYKDALKLSPNDKDTKYNLAYANSMLMHEKQQQQKDKNKKDDKKDDKKKDQDKKDQQQQNQNQRPDSKEGDQQSKNDQQKNDQQKKGQQPKLTRDEAEKLLQALMNEEQKTNQKVQQKQMRPVNAKIEKDW